MAQGTIGVQVAAADAAGLLQQIEHAEQLGIPAVWATSEGPDALTLFAAAAMRTSRVLMGTAIVRAGTRHPIAMAQQAAAIAQLAPGRLLLGLGPVIAGQAAFYGPGPARPLAHLRAYIRTVRELLETGQANVDEAGVVAHGRISGAPADVPLLASALRPASFALCGAVADGAITWICPAGYVERVCLPAVREAAVKAQRPAPPIIMHVPVVLSTDIESVRAIIRERFAFYVRVPNYAAMFEQAGFPEVKEGRWSDAMIDAVTVYGSEKAVGDRINALFQMGAGELLITALGTAADPAGGAERVLRLVGELSQA